MLALRRCLPQGFRHPHSRWIATRAERFEPFLPPDPSKLPKPSKPRPRSKLGRRLVLVGATSGTLYLGDRYLNYSTFSRNLRTIYVASLIALDYKINFNREAPAEQLARIHERTAERILDLCFTNGGLYQKIGQAIAMQTQALPAIFQEKFRMFFDETPQASFREIEKVLREEYGGASWIPGLGKWDENALFVPGTFERKAIGSASIAQVHKAQLKTGEWVAVKIQKPGISRQVFWDLAVFKFCMDFFSKKMFALNLSFVAPFICERIGLECDFVNEAKNSEHMRGFIESEPDLKGRVYIPKVYPGISTKRIMIAEWIEGVPVADKEKLLGPYRGHSYVGKEIPGAGGAVYGLGVSAKKIMKTMVDLFCAQIFLAGWVHCDPHPGNMLVRRLPNGNPELVLLDHGLYVQTSPRFREEYALFWRALLTFDNEMIANIAEKWGIGNRDLFASAVLLRPYTGGDKETLAVMEGRDGSTAYERHQKMREMMTSFLADEETEKMPQELIFIGRNMRIVQGNNAILGSPVNRVRIVGNWASYSLTKMPGVESGGWLKYLIFKAVIYASDIVFYFSRFKQFFLGGLGFEEQLELRMKKVAKEEFGVELSGEVFAG